MKELKIKKIDWPSIQDKEGIQLVNFFMYNCEPFIISVEKDYFLCLVFNKASKQIVSIYKNKENTPNGWELIYNIKSTKTPN
jgi:hypothetical protein